MRFQNKVHSNWWALALLLIICCNLNVVESKRSFGIGRSRPKVSNPNIRRRGHTVAEAPRAAPQAPQAKTPSAPAGPPPAYSAGANAPKTNPHELPPSYSQATGLGNSPNSFSNANYPRQTYTGVNSNSYSGTNNMHHPQPPPSYGQSNFGHTPYNTGPYNSMPMGGGYSPGMGGGYSPGMGMGMGYGGGMMGGGMMGGGMMGGYGHKSSSPFSMGNILTGLAVWQLARGFGGSNSHNTHIYHHYDNNQPQQTTYAGGVQTPQTYAGSVPAQAVIPAAVDQSASATVAVANATAQEPSNQSNPIPPETVTSIPEFDSQFPFSTIHPSLFPYGRQSESLEYWATSHTKTLRTSSPDTSDSTITSTTSTTTKATDEAPESTTISQLGDSTTGAVTTTVSA